MKALRQWLFKNLSGLEHLKVGWHVGKYSVGRSSLFVRKRSRGRITVIKLSPVPSATREEFFYSTTLKSFKNVLLVDGPTTAFDRSGQQLINIHHLECSGMVVVVVDLFQAALTCMSFAAFLSLIYILISHHLQLHNIYA